MARYDLTCNQWHLYAGDECWMYSAPTDVLIRVRLLLITRYHVTFRALPGKLRGRRDTPEAQLYSNLGELAITVSRSQSVVRFGALESLRVLKNGKRILPVHESALILDSASVPA